MKKIGLLGCTGSIGKNTLDVIRSDKNFSVSLLANYSDLIGLKALIKEFSPEIAICLSEKYLYKDGKEYALSDVNVLADETLYDNCDLVINGILGLAGLLPSLTVIKSGKILATANKESFVCAGEIINECVKKYDGTIYPLDSEHSAVWQLIQGKNNVKDIYITASGGAFRDKTKEELAACPASDALKHPNWIMGKKVTIDCATLMNKGMEIIEAKHLFNRIPKVLGHRESYVHALVEFTDGTYNANISEPSMFYPISYALHYPNGGFFNKNTSLVGKSFNFFELDEDRFPCLAIAKKVVNLGDIAGCVMNAADEILVNRYLKGEIGFYDIPEGIEKTLNKFSSVGNFNNIDDVFRIDKESREYTLSMRFGGKR